MFKEIKNKIVSSILYAITILMLGTLVPALVTAEETTVESDVNVTSAVMVDKPLPKLTPKARETVRAVQQDKRVDVKNINTEAKAKVGEERAKLQEAQMQAKMEGMTLEERSKMMEMRKGTAGEIKNIRTERIAEVKDRREEARGDIKKAIGDRKMRMASTTDAKKEERKQKAVEKAANLADKMIKRLSAAIERLEKLAIRIESRIEKVKAAGGVTTAAETALAEANVKIQAAKDGLVSISATFAAAATAENPKDGVRKMQEAVQAVHAEIKTAAESLKNAVKALEGQKGVDVAASVVIEASVGTVEPTSSVTTNVEGNAEVNQ